MAERINEIKYSEPSRSSTLEPFETNLFITQPAEFLVSSFVDELKNDPAWSLIFGGYIEDYERMDFSIRSLPAMRIYCERYRKDGETWYENGEIIIDVIWPASIRRGELNRLPQTIAGAMIQQLRRPSFFQTLCDRVPGLNEFGKTINVDFDLGFKWQDDLIPLTRITANFRILLNEWDDYLQSDYRTIDAPFLRTLGDLQRIATTIQALRSNDPDDIELTIGIDQNK
jgi:hypothetical protein